MEMWRCTIFPKDDDSEFLKLEKSVVFQSVEIHITVYCFYEGKSKVVPAL
jgi:hypothetical protein